MQVSTSAFYAWNKAPEDTDKKVLQKQLEAKAIQLFDENKKIYGSRRLSEAFIKEDIQVGRYKAKHLMKKLGLKPRYPKRFKVTTDSDRNEAISPNLLDRQFDVAAPNKVWTTDIIEWRKPWSSECLSHNWGRFFIGIPMGIGQGALRMMPLHWSGDVVGSMTGRSNSTLKDCSTTSITNC